MRRITYLGFMKLDEHKRGVENVILFQSMASKNDCNYYFYWGERTSVNKYNNLICIGLRKKWYWPIVLNVVMFKLKIRDKKLFIHSHNPLMSLVCLFRTNLITVHDALYYLMSASKHNLKLIFLFLEKFLYLRCDFVHFISKFAKFKSLYSGNNYEIIYNTSYLEPKVFDKIHSVNNISLECNKKKKILVVRSIEERARIDLILGVAGILDSSSFEFVIVGKGPLLKLYIERSAHMGLDNVKFLGYASENQLINFYTNCDIVIVTAEYGEGFGLPIIEGYLFNKVVLASNVCAIPEIIISEKHLFENSVESIAEKVKNLSSLSNNLYRDYYKSTFSNTIVNKQVYDLYKRLM